MEAPAIASIFDHLAVRVYVLGVLLGIVTIPWVLASQRSSTSKVAWILVLVGWPWVGVIGYAMFGRNRLSRKVVRLRNAGIAALAAVPGRVRHALESPDAMPSRLTRDLVLEAWRSGGFPPYPGNRTWLCTEGDESQRMALETVEGARHHIHLQTYIFRDDRTGQQALDALIRAARRGVEVRVVYDALGTYRTSGKFFQPLKDAGGEVRPFLPIVPFHQLVRINLRNHRKLLVVDGKTAFIGGRNIGDEYAKDPNWRDLHVVIDGPASRALQRVFVEDWHFATEKLLDAEAYFPPACPVGEVPVQVLPAGPDREGSPVEDVLFSAIAGARDRVDLVSPYFVPTEPLCAALRSALQQGRRVRMLMGRRVDHRIVRWAGDALLLPLVRMGLQLWAHPGMVHAKVLVVDDQWATLGSANFDARSLRLNFELNVAFPHAPSARALREYVDAEIAASTRVEPKDLTFGWGGRTLRQAAALFSPIL